MPQTLERKLMSWCFLIEIGQRISEGDASAISGWQSHVLKRSYHKRLILLVTGHHVPKLGKTNYWQIQSHRSLIRQKKSYVSYQGFFNKVFKMRFRTGARIAAQMIFPWCFPRLFPLSRISRDPSPLQTLPTAFPPSPFFLPCDPLGAS